MKRIIMGAALMFGALTGIWGQTNSPPVLTTDRINDLADEARTNNAALWAARARVNAAEQNALAVPIWRDPEVFAGGMAAERAMRAEDGDILYGVEQALPIFGKEKALRRAAEAEIPFEEAGLDYELQMLKKNLAAALYEAAYRDENLALIKEEAAWIETFARTVEERYRASEAGQLDLLRAQNERSRFRQQVATEENARMDAYAAVNRILNRNMFAAWESMALPQVAEPLYLNERLIDFALRFEPKLKALKKQLDKARAVEAAVRLEKRPDLAVELEGRNYSRTGEGRSAMVLMKMKLPWLNRDKYRAAHNREKARVNEVESLIEDYSHQAREELHHMISKIDNARREALLYRDEIIPRSELALSGVEAAWRANRATLPDVLDARQILIQGRRSYYRAVADQYIALSELVLCCGAGDLEALQMLQNKDQSSDSADPMSGIDGSSNQNSAEESK